MRAYISDFAVITAIVLMVLVDIAFGINTPKLVVPDKFSPTWSGKRKINWRRRIFSRGDASWQGRVVVHSPKVVINLPRTYEATLYRRTI